MCLSRFWGFEGRNVAVFKRYCEVKLTHPFFQGEWHFPENLKIDGDTARVLKSGKILNHRGVRAKSNTKQPNSGGIQFLLPKSFIS